MNKSPLLGFYGSVFSEKKKNKMDTRVSFFSKNTRNYGRYLFGLTNTLMMPPVNAKNPNSSDESIDSFNTAEGRENNFGGAKKEFDSNIGDSFSNKNNKPLFASGFGAFFTNPFEAFSEGKNKSKRGSVFNKKNNPVEFGSAESKNNFKKSDRGSKGSNIPFVFGSAGKKANVNSKYSDKVVSITYEEIGLFPRSFSRVLDRFLKQIFSDVENLVIQEYRFYRYLFLTTIQTIIILLFVPLVVHFIAKTYLIKPITEYFWNTKQTEIFLNSYEQKRAFIELQDFEEKLYFESLLISSSSNSAFRFSSAEENLSAGIEKTQNGIVGAPAVESVLQQVGQRPLSSSFPFGIDKNILPIRNFMNSSTKIEQPEVQLVPEVETDQIQRNNQNKTFASSAFLGFDYKPGAESLNLQSGAGGVSLNGQKNFKAGALAQDIFDPTVLNVLNSKSNDLQERLQEKTLELAIRYNNHSIEAITNFFADFLSLITLLYLLISLEIQINITKSFLLEVFFGLDDSKKSLLILILTDLLVGYHSSNLWELFFQFLFNHYGIPESQTGIFLLVATLPVLLDVLFKYLIFRHLNRASPATVATYHAIIE